MRRREPPSKDEKGSGPNDTETPNKDGKKDDPADVETPKVEKGAPDDRYIRHIRERGNISPVQKREG